MYGEINRVSLGKLMTEVRWQFGPDLAWQLHAACAKARQPDQFFPGGGRPSNESKVLCLDCPVRDDCLGWALNYEEQGIWGGLTEGERKRLASRSPHGRTRSSGCND